jgi:hypothetical protein
MCESTYTPGNLPELGDPEPGTGTDWAAAEGPGSPLPPAPITMRPWDSLKGNDVPTDREKLAHYEEVAAKEGHDGEWANALNEVAAIRNRAANGYHDGSLPELGHFRPVYFDGINKA